MPITIPDSSWYRSKSSEADVPFSCPYANVHKCHRYYASIKMLGEKEIITTMSADKKEALDAFWEESNLLPVIVEATTGFYGGDVKSGAFSNLCPEVSFDHFHYYASFLAKYADEIDRDYGSRVAFGENISNDWRHQWSAVAACHFLDCGVFSQVRDFNSKGIGKFDQLAHSNVVVLIGRMEQCLEKNDPSGVLHAASNILETMAKDIIGSDKIANQPLGGFIEKYKNESALPEEIKDVVGAIYNLRNKTPLSGHGSTNTPTINMRDAILIAAATKFVLEIEYRNKTL